jgi:molecular chaperone GrpE
MEETQYPIPPEPAAAPQPAPQAPPGDDLQKKCDEYLEGWKRATADYANLKKEHERERADFAKYAAANALSSLLPVLDSFAKADAAKPTRFAEAAQHAQWADGVSLVRQQFEGAMRSAGVAAIDQAGVPFDPTLHEAMMLQKGGAPGTVLKVLEPGYKLHDRVLRPAKVVVAE